MFHLYNTNIHKVDERFQKLEVRIFENNIKVHVNNAAEIAFNIPYIEVLLKKTEIERLLKYIFSHFLYAVNHNSLNVTTDLWQEI